MVRTFGIFFLLLMSMLTLTCVHHLDQKALLPDPPSPDQDEDQTPEEESSGEEIKSKVR